MDSEIDADWAWAPFMPAPDRPWDQRLAAHLFRRAGFGATWEQLTEAVSASPSEAVDRLLNADEPADYRKQTAALSDAAVAVGKVPQLSAWWCHRMLTTPAQLLEKTTLFWHGHFATSAAKVPEIRLMLAQNELLRRFAFGDFGQLLLEVSRDPAMLMFLDSATNRKAHPNENYAREIMELFCLGEGNYTENDIRELARSFTGWEIRRDKFRFNSFQHDSGTKTILGQTGEFGGEDGVRIVLQQKSAPEFLIDKLIRFFVFDEPVPSKALVAPLAAQLRDSGMQIRPVLKRILSSNLFYSEHAVGRKVRSPVELAIGFLRCLEGSTNSFELSEQMNVLGQGLFFPPSVKGWDGGRTWINSSTLLGRSNLIRHLLEHEKTRFGRKSLAEYLNGAQLTSAESIINRLQTLLFAVPVPMAAREQIADLIDGSGDRNRSLTEGLHALCTLPEFQLC
jgi:uncharacterized protein (DUF1800 family)